ncbi:MAG TPA: flagellar export chaperone FlgN [Acidimicrobiia bacterium]|nr:flagellar export chaperone FlgN [Acidimicrobiia bacterium]
MGLREVSAILWRERHLLELLLFKLDEEQLVLAAGRTRWLPRATREVEMVLEEIRQTELERALEVTRVAVDLGLGGNASLRQLADAAPEPWQGMLTEHRAAFLSLTEEVTALVQTNRELLNRGQKAVREVLASIGDGRVEVGAGSYGGRPAAPPAGRPFLIDEAL